MSLGASMGLSPRSLAATCRPSHDERVHESEEAAGAARFGVGRGLRGGHERNENTSPGSMSRNLFQFLS